MFMRLGVTMPTRTVGLDRVGRYAQWAEKAGLDSAWDWELYRNPFTMLALCAETTHRLQLGTGLAATASRSPFEMANAVADVDELSGGRALLGIGSGVVEFVSAFHDTAPSKPLTRVSEYIDVLRLSWQYLGTGEAPSYHGQFHSFTPPPFNPWGTRPMARPGVPIYLGAIGPKMLNLVGRKGDGWIGYLGTRELVRDYVRPAVAAGAVEAGRDPADIDIMLELICVVHDDPEVAMQRARKHVGFYVSHPSSDPLVAFAGLTDEVNALRAASLSEGLAAFEKTSDEIVHTFSITGTPDEARAQLAGWDGIADHLVFHTPYVPPFTAEESEDCFRNICRAFAR
jgi:alkanesulfonate monooxygenase SsuD/methylene tetrahydromethanopterin reductase-like flavin-dependent oxidoreductase (luciferase family)